MASAGRLKMSDGSSGSCAKRLLRHTSIYAAGNILRQLTGFIMLPVYTRFLTPADYGVVGLMVFVISLIELALGVRLQWAIPKYYFEVKDEHEQSSIVSTAMIISGVISGATATLLILLSKPLSRSLFGSPEFATIFGLFSVLLLTQSLEQYALVYLRLQQRPWSYITLNLVKLIMQLGLNIWFVVYLKMGALGVAVSTMISSSLFALLQLIYTLRHVGWNFNSEIAGKMIRFCWPLWISGFAGLYIGSANRYYLRIFYSLGDIGLLELASRFSAIISVLVWDPFATFWQVERFKYFHRENAERLFQSVFNFISTMLVMAALGVSIFAERVIRIMADTTFYRASQAVPFLAIATVFSSLSMFSNFSFLVKEKTGWMSRNTFLTAAIITPLYLVLIPVYGHVGAAIALTVANGTQFLIIHISSRRVYDMGISLKPLAMMILTSVIVFVFANLVWGRENLLEDIAVKSLLFVTAGTIILFPVWQKVETRNLLLDLASSILRPNQHPGK